MDGETKRRPAEGVRVALAQIAPVLGDVNANLEKLRAAVARAKEEGANVLVFPELALTGYRLKDAVPEVAVSRDDDVMTELATLADGISLLVGLVEETREHFFFNAAVWFEAGRAVYTHRKTYLPTYGMFDEQRYFARGKRIRAFDTECGRTGVLVCEDMLHPTAATIAALDGAETIYVPSASPVRGVNEPGEVDVNGQHWEGYIRTMARALGVFVVYVNRVGVEDGHTFWGGSEIVGPDGATLVKAAYFEEDFVSAVLPEGEIRRRRMQSPLLRDEDLDLTINELERLRERPSARAGARAGAGEEGHRQPREHGRGDESRGDSPPRGNRWQGGRDEGGRGGWQPRDDRARDSRGPWRPREEQGQPRGRWQPRPGDDRARGGRWQPRGDDARPQQQRWQPRDDRGQGQGSRDRWQGRGDQQPRENRGRWEDREGNRAGGNRGPSTGGDDRPRGRYARPAGGAEPPARYRPERGERRSRALGEPFTPPAKDDGDKDEEA